MTDQLTLDETTRRQLRPLTRPPRIAWPTVALLAACLLVLATSVTAGVTRTLPLWGAALINTVMAYLLFSVIHDSIHRAVAQSNRFNDWCGRLAATGMSPGTTLGLFRWGHIQHHRHTTGPGDPDNWLHGGRAWTLPLRWAVIDVYYLVYALHSGDRVARRYLPATLMGLTFTVVAVAVLLALGYWAEVLMLWLVPTRLNAMLLGFTFFWLPHVPHDVSAADDPYRATNVRWGHEWLLTPLLQYHNYHLIHHLYPRTPFYNHMRVWRLLAPALRRQTLSVQHGLHIVPERQSPSASTQ